MFLRQAEVEIAPERPIYLPGEVVNARVRIWGTGDLAIEEARVELRRSQRYAYERRVRDSDGDYRWDRTVTTEHTVCGVARILDKGLVQKGAYIEEFVAFRLPESADPTGNAGLLDTGWNLQIVLNRRLAIDITATAGIVVLAPAALYAGRIGTGWRGHQADECAVEIQIPDRNVPVGVLLEGTMLVRARRAVEPRSMRIELLRVEETEGGPGGHATRGRSDSTTVLAQQIAGAGSLPFDTPCAFTFAVPISRDLPPTTFTGRGSVRWLLRGVVDRRMATDYWGEIEINLHNGPALPAAPAAPPDGGTATADPPGERATPRPGDLPPVAAPARLVLIGTDGGALAGRAFPVEAPEITLGRRETNTIVVPDLAVSRVHAAIRRAGGDYLLRDAGSTSGTLVNGERLGGERALRDGDIVGLGASIAFVARLLPGSGDEGAI